MTPREVRLSHGSVQVVDAGSGPPLVLLHGLGGTWRNWGANIAALAERHRVIAPDLPGFGDSERYTGKVSMSRYVDSIVELLDALGVKQATLVGNSMGGLLTIEAAARYPDRVQAAILVSPGGIPLTSLRHRLITVPRARLLNRLLMVSFVRKAVRDNARIRRVVGGQLFHNPDAIPQDVLVGALSYLAAPGFGPALSAGTSYDIRRHAAAVACPTLILWGREDRLLPLWMAAELRRFVPDSRLVVWDEIGHCAMLEDPARFDSLVEGFIGELDRRAARTGNARRSA